MRWNHTHIITHFFFTFALFYPYKLVTDHSCSKGERITQGCEHQKEEIMEMPLESVATGY